MTLPPRDAMRTVSAAARRRRVTGLWSLAYVSRMTTPLPTEELVALALHAERANRTLGVTGALFLDEDRFLQILEGDRRAVGWLIARIETDPRHTRLLRVFDGPIDARMFASWSMRCMDEKDLSPERRRVVLDSIARAERLDEIGGRLAPVEFAHCYAALCGSAPCWAGARRSAP